MTIANPNRDYVWGEVLPMLRASGCPNATERRLRLMMIDGKLPRPEKDASGRCLYSAEFIEQARLILLDLPSAKRQTITT